MWARSLLYELLKLDHTTLDTLSTISLVDTETLPWQQEAISSAGMLWRSSVRKRSYKDSTSLELTCGNAESSVPVAVSVVIRTSMAPSTSDRYARSGSLTPYICDSNNSITASVVFKGKCFILWRTPFRLLPIAERPVCDMSPSSQLSKCQQHFRWFAHITRRITSRVSVYKMVTCMVTCNNKLRVAAERCESTISITFKHFVF